MCATFREMAVTFILLYFTFSDETQANQSIYTKKFLFFAKSKNGAFWVVIRISDLP